MTPALLIGLLLAAPATTLAASPAPAWRAVAGPGDTIELRKGDARLAVVTPSSAPNRRGVAIVKATTVGAEQVIEVRIPFRSRPAEAEVWLGKVGPSAVMPLWTGRVGPQDADGETSQELTITSDGVLLFQTAGRVGRCDGQPARLFPRRLDLATGLWADAEPHASRPVSPNPSLVVKRGGAGLPTGRPRLRFAFTASASPPADARSRDVRALVAPLAVSDGDPETVWAERGSAGGRGAWMTARAAAGARVTGVRLLPGDARSRTRYLARGRARSLSLIFGPAPDQHVDVQLEDGTASGDGQGRPFWIPLPHPVASSCLTIEVNEVTPGLGAERDVLAWTEIDVFTELDGADGLVHLAEGLLGADCEGRVADVIAAGPDALPAVIGSLGRAPAGGRACVLDAVSGIAGAHPSTGNNAALAAALVAALRGATASEERSIDDLLAGLPAAPVTALAAAMTDEAAAIDDRLRAVRALVRLDGSEAHTVLLGAVGAGPPPLREALRQVGGAQGSPTLEEARSALVASPRTATARRADLMRLMGLIAAHGRAGPAAHPALSDEDTSLLVTAANDETEAFEVRGRAVGALESIPGSAATTALERVRSQSREAPLRRLAIRALAVRAEAEATNALRAAISDADPAVRETAVAALGRRHDVSAGPLLVAAAKQEPWPTVRRSEIVALSRTCGPGAGDLLLRAVERDLPEIRRAALSGLVTCHDERAPQVLLDRLQSSEETVPVRTQAARELGQIGSRRLGPPVTAAFEQLRTESQTDPILEETAVATLSALAAIGGPEATRAALATRSDPRPVLRRAAVDALGHLCGTEADGALREAAHDPDGAVAAAARTALRACSGGGGIGLHMGAAR